MPGFANSGAELERSFNQAAMERSPPGATKDPGGMSLEYMTKEQLDEFISRNPDLGLSEQEVSYLYIRRRRLSVDRAQQHGLPVSLDAGEAGPSAQVLPPGEAIPFKITVLGDERCSGHVDMINLFQTGAQQTSALPLSIIRKTILMSDESEAGEVAVLEIWTPPCEQEYRTLRPLHYAATDLFVLVFSVTEPDSLQYVHELLDAEVKAYQKTVPHRTIPVVLVGNYAEKRVEGSGAGSGNLVSAQSAIHTAQQCGFLKYIEVHSYNVSHINEVFRQCVRAIGTSRSSNVQMGHQEYDREYLKEHQVPGWVCESVSWPQVLSSHVTQAAPSGHFDPLTGTFSFDVPPGVAVLYTLDDSGLRACCAGLTGFAEPSRASMRYTEPLQLTKPYPRCIRAIALCRGRAISLIATIELSTETVSRQAARQSLIVVCQAGHQAHFDVINRRFVIDGAGDAQYFYTLDGTAPDPITALPYSGPVEMPLNEHPQHGDRLRLLAQRGSGLQASAFDVPMWLPPPQVSLDDGMLRISPTVPSTMQDMVQYRYTTDGSTPTIHSELYTQPVVFTQPLPQQVTVVAFPLLMFPSTPVEVQWGEAIGSYGAGASRLANSPPGAQQGPTQAQAAQMAAAEALAAHQAAEAEREQLEAAQAAEAAGAGAYPVTTQQQSPQEPLEQRWEAGPQPGQWQPSAGPPQENVWQPVDRTGADKLFDQIDTNHDGVIDRSEFVQGMPQPLSARSEHPIQWSSTAAREGRSASLEYMAKTFTDGNTVTFTFEAPVCIERLTITTPGNGQGPAAYSCAVTQTVRGSNGQLEHRAAHLCDGALQDVEGEQDLEVAEVGDSSCISLQCEFFPMAGTSTFKVLQFHIFGSY